jgi:chaperonin cofactor prefoldin
MEEKIIKAIEALTGKVDNMANDIGVMKTDISMVKTDISEIKQKVNAINDQTADLTEFRTETREKLELIENGIEVLGKEDFKNKVELIEIKKKIAK